MRFFLFLLLVITVTSSKGKFIEFSIHFFNAQVFFSTGEDIQDGLNELKSKIQDEQNEISEMLLNTIKDVTEVSSMNVNDDPIVTPAMTELNNYLEVMKSSVDESSLVTNLMEETTLPPINITSNSSNCVNPFIYQSIQNVGEAQQLVSNILTNVSNTLSSVSSNFNELANLNSTGNSSNVVFTVFTAVSSILHSVVQFTNDQITQVNNRIENDFNAFSQVANNMTACQPSNPIETSSIASNNEASIVDNESTSTESATVDSATAETTSESTTSSPNEGLSKGNADEKDFPSFFFSFKISSL